MSVTREMAYGGRVVLRLDELDRAREIYEYNAGLWASRRKMRLLKELRFGFCVLTPLLLLGMLVTCGDTMFKNVPLAAVILAAEAASYIFALVKKGRARPRGGKRSAPAARPALRHTFRREHNSRLHDMADGKAAEARARLPAVQRHQDRVRGTTAIILKALPI